MATSYPGGLDAFTNPAATDPLNSATVPHATQHTDVNDAIEAIEAELGTDPSGASATVKARFEAIEAAGWVTSARILDGTILDADINAAAAIAPSKISGTAVVDADARMTNARTPTAHASTHAAAGSDPVTLTTAQVTGLDSALAGKTDDVDLPYHVCVPSITPMSAGGQTSAYAAAAIFNCASGSIATVNNFQEWTIFVAAGTYTLRTIYRMNSNQGIASISVDGGAALGTTIDFYAAGSTYNNITDITSIALTAGRHTIRYTAATKNASSSAYYLNIQGFALVRTGA